MSMTCDKCGGNAKRVEKTSISGNYVSTYYCKHCDRYFDVEEGKALWKLIDEWHSRDREPD